MIAQATHTATAKTIANTCSTYAEQWNSLKPNQRKKLMVEAGYQSNKQYIYRVWSFIPASIRHDVIAVLKKQKQASTPQPATHVSKFSASTVRKPYWWQIEKDLEVTHA